jgi:hypothetical protein
MSKIDEERWELIGTLSYEEIVFLHNQAEKRLKDAKESIHLLLLRSSFVITVVVAVIFFLINFCLKMIGIYLFRYRTDLNLEIILYTALCIIFYLIPLFLLIMNFNVPYYNYVGRGPFSYHIDENKKEGNLKMLMIQDLKVYAISISKFWDEYEIKHKRINKALKMILFGTLTIFVFLVNSFSGDPLSNIINNVNHYLKHLFKS